MFPLFRGLSFRSPLNCVIPIFRSCLWSVRICHFPENTDCFLFSFSLSDRHCLRPVQRRKVVTKLHSHRGSRGLHQHVRYQRSQGLQRDKSQLSGTAWNHRLSPALPRRSNQISGYVLQVYSWLFLVQNVCQIITFLATLKWWQARWCHSCSGVCSLCAKHTTGE